MLNKLRHLIHTAKNILFPKFASAKDVNYKTWQMIKGITNHEFYKKLTLNETNVNNVPVTDKKAIPANLNKLFVYIGPNLTNKKSLKLMVMYLYI